MAIPKQRAPVPSCLERDDLPHPGHGLVSAWVRLSGSLLLALFLTSCASLSPAEKMEKQQQLDAMAERAIATLLQKNPDLTQKFDEAVGYMVLDAKLTKIPMVGGGSGEGVIVNNLSGERTYVKASRFDIGGGWGVRTFKSITVFQDQKVLAAAEKGGLLYRSGAELAAGAAAAEGAVAVGDKGYQTFALSETGASATVTVRVISLKPYF